MVAEAFRKNVRTCVACALSVLLGYGFLSGLVTPSEFYNDIISNL
ncbi:hypothetical protein AmDm5_2046 [Acetobacter malorum]|nr:hypothetical protein AmDm5_2046 [Acetobacter malorum]